MTPKKLEDVIVESNCSPLEPAVSVLGITKTTDDRFVIQRYRNFEGKEIGGKQFKDDGGPLVSFQAIECEDSIDLGVKLMYLMEQFIERGVYASVCAIDSRSSESDKELSKIEKALVKSASGIYTSFRLRHYGS